MTTQRFSTAAATSVLQYLVDIHTKTTPYAHPLSLYSSLSTLTLCTRFLSAEYIFLQVYTLY
jgi:hypothetical protein